MIFIAPLAAGPGVDENLTSCRQLRIAILSATAQCVQAFHNAPSLAVRTCPGAIWAAG